MRDGDLFEKTDHDPHTTFTRLVLMGQGCVKPFYQLQG